MAEETSNRSEVDQFILDQIDSVPHLEALLLLWNQRPKNWSVDEMAKALFVSPGSAREILQNLTRRRLIAPDPSAADAYFYEASPEKDRLIGMVNATYKRELIRLSNLIHSKPSAAIREFAKAFRFKKEGD